MVAKKKVIAVMLVGMLMVSGCGRKEVDYNLDQNQGDTGDNAGTADGALADRLGIPKSYSGDIRVGNSGLVCIAIEDYDIEVPSTDSMRIEYLEANTMDAEYKQKIAQTVFGRSDGIYQYDYEQIIRSKHDIEQEMEIKQWCIDYMKNAGETEFLDEYEEDLVKLQQDYENAPEEHETPGDWSASKYIGDMGDIQFMLEFSPYNEALYFVYHISYNMAPILYRPYRGAMQAFYSSGDDIEAEEGENQCSWNREEALEMARDFLNDCGIKDVAVEWERNLKWQYFASGSSEDITNEIDGYSFRFVRSIDGNAVYHEDTYEVDTLTQGAEFYEIYDVWIDDNGVLDAYCYDMFRPTGQTEENVSLLSWKEILEIADITIPEYYTEHKTNYDTVTFNDVKLTYFLVNGKDENSYQYIPVWVFEEENENGAPIQLIMMDAVTGEQIDINERKFEDIEFTKVYHYR